MTIEIDNKFEMAVETESRLALGCVREIEDIVPHDHRSGVVEAAERWLACATEKEQTDRQEYWGETPPNALVWGTGSNRKKLMLFALLNGLVMPGGSGEPGSLQSYFGEKVYNGDNSSKDGPRRLGSWHGVPVYSESIGVHIEDSNEPERESRGKALAVAQRYWGENVLVVGDDTVGNVNGVSLGKPAGREDYPKIGDYRNGGFERAADEYLRTYRDQTFRPGDILGNANGISIVDCKTEGGGFVYTVVSKRKLEIPDASRMREIQLDAYAGGGGCFQNLVDWGDDQQILELSGDINVEVDDITVKRWALFCQISGMPMYRAFSEAQFVAKTRVS